MKSLILVVTRRCNQRCTYCPVVKDGGPDMSISTARLGLRMFVSRFGGGNLKLFGGEPLLSQRLVATILKEAENEPLISKVTLCTNGALLNEDLLRQFERHPKLWLALSLDGHPEDHLANRHSVEPGEDALERIHSLLPQLRRFPRIVVTQVVAPATASRAEANFSHLLSLGFRRFNLLPAGWVLWTPGQLEALRLGLTEISSIICAEWRAGRSLYLRNLFNRTPQPTFTSGIIVDVDGRIFPSDCVLADLDQRKRAELCCGSVETPPSAEELDHRAALVSAILDSFRSANVAESTRAADEILHKFCHGLTREYLLRRSRPEGHPL